MGDIAIKISLLNKFSEHSKIEIAQKPAQAY